MPITTQELLQQLNDVLKPWEVSDYCPNGLQVEGSPNISRLITGVTASQALIDAAVEQQADAILVHHGYFWKGESAAITGMKKRRIQTLLEHGINLIAYHLPIDVHPTLGNNAQLGRLLALPNPQPLSSVKPLGIVFQSHLTEPVSQAELGDRIGQVLGRDPLAEGDPGKPIQRVAWCTGGGQSFIEQAVEAGMDAFISGEVSEQTIHVAREMDIHFFAAGHHATERYGVKAVGEWLSQNLGLDVNFVDIDNPA
ncbi:Nif3-like dinuclear metal center hexameric protein [Alteromonas aestuariivivens]|uniref:GTP cyclohydrolase 1 type 2 homolog n=1 Tax=Alteromonas aestuariivivens TaxID=1938339 RepID=A0A3D8M8H3_9ALTE|nr:Nif3-like dinuclear metal center hexameric protein [Alteromonas aestuariivivens]RDV26195.1 Nif3-like dinuclear metal center hexameric protein [Alteromonas aestuariivivens]